MSDHDDDRLTPIPGPSEPIPVPAHDEALEADLERPKPESFGQTQPIKPPTAEDVIEIFGHFRQDLLGQIDKRDKRILQAIKDIGATIADYYQRETTRGDKHAKTLDKHDKTLDEQGKWIGQLRRRTHKLSTGQQEINIRLAEIERQLGITPPATTPAETPPKPEPT